jgi:hypothetical protein
MDTHASSTTSVRQQKAHRYYEIRLEDRRLEMENYHRGPSLFALAIVFTILFLASIAVYALTTNSVAAAHFAAFLLFGASIPLGLFTATIVSRLQFHRINVAGVHIALFGGIAAAIFMAFSALASWATAQPELLTASDSTRISSQLIFATGGFGHTAGLGLLLAGVSIPCFILGLMPRWVCWLGLIVFGICELSTLGMFLPWLSFLLPLGRFPALVWLIAAGATMPKSKIVGGEPLE